MSWENEIKKRKSRQYQMLEAKVQRALKDIYKADMELNALEEYMKRFSSSNTEANLMSQQIYRDCNKLGAELSKILSALKDTEGHIIQFVKTMSKGN